MSCLFTDGWYQGMLDQTKDYFHEETSADGYAIASATLVGLLCIAQAIDNALGHTSPQGTAVSSLDGIASALDRVADEIEKGNSFAVDRNQEPDA